MVYNQEVSNPHATLGVMYDFSKAFNRQDHNKLISILSDLGTPGWLLKLVMAILSDRRIVLKYKGCTSREETLPGGGPQGTKLGLFLFLMLIFSLKSLLWVMIVRVRVGCHLESFYTYN